MTERHIVTGAFGFTGRHIARRLLAAGHDVATLTNRVPREDPSASRVHVRPLDFDDPAGLVESLRGAAVLYNTYWVRYRMAGADYGQAVENSRRLFAATRQAGVRRVVHVSITNPDANSPFGYFRGKARVERALVDSGLSHAILRPAVLFGDEGILINNIAWALRRLPVFGLFGDGRYRLQPIHVDDLAALALAQGGGSENVTLDAVGPETFTFRELVAAVAAAIGVRRALVPLPASLAWALVWALGRLKGDVIVTWEEMKALMADRLYTGAPPAGPTRLTDWLAGHGDELGRQYMNETARRRGQR